MIEILVFSGDDGIHDGLRNRAQRNRETILHLVVVNGSDQLRRHAYAAQRDAVIEPLDVAHRGSIKADRYWQRAKFDVRILEILQIDFERVSSVAIFARIGYPHPRLVIADVIELWLEQRAGRA